MDSEALLLGRKTFQAFAAVWPSMNDPAGLSANTSDKKGLRLSESKTVGDGIAILIFKPAIRE
jgi:hypothetical protein